VRAKEYAYGKKKSQGGFVIANGFPSLGRSRSDYGEVRKPLDIDYFNLNLTISDNGNGKEYKGSFISMRTAELVPDVTQDTTMISMI
jgi:hypothetical protein